MRWCHLRHHWPLDVSCQQKKKKLRTAHANFPILIKWQVLNVSFNCRFFTLDIIHCVLSNTSSKLVQNTNYLQEPAGGVVSRWWEQGVTAHKLAFFKSSSLRMVKDISPFDRWTPAKLSAHGSWHGTTTHWQCHSGKNHSGKKRVEQEAAWAGWQGLGFDMYLVSTTVVLHVGIKTECMRWFMLMKVLESSLWMLY